MRPPARRAGARVARPAGSPAPWPSTLSTFTCHTALVAFHETFWAVSAGVAPVIALAAVVSAGQAARDRDQVIEANRTVAGFPAFGTKGDPVIRKAFIGFI